MGRGIDVRRLELSLAEVRERASRCRDGRVACRTFSGELVMVESGLGRCASNHGSRPKRMEFTPLRIGFS
jgi:hypothetical protein